MSVMRKNILTLKEIVYSGIFVALTIVGAQIAIPIGPVPITFQTLFVILSGLMLGARVGFFTQFAYVIMGIVGLPVFAGFTGGIVQLYGPLGGYLIAFPLAALASGFVIEKKKSITNYILAALLGICIIYTSGWLRLGIYMHDFKKAFLVGVAPFILWDFLKGLLAVYVAIKVQIHTEKS
jgi:biotin transport system substrate-specific component